MSEIYIGLIPGADALTAAVADFAQHPPVLLATHVEPLEQSLRREITALSRPGANELERAGQLDVRLGRALAATALAALRKCGLQPWHARAIGSDGQTLRHRPLAQPPFTVQIGDPNIIAEITGIATVADFRRRDLAAGGRGAPLVPAFHEVLFRSAEQDRAVINIGDMASITGLPRDPAKAVSGFDTGPGTALMEDWARGHLGTSLDRDGAWAATGRVDNSLLSLMLADPYFALDPPKSTGRDYFNVAWLELMLQQVKVPLPQAAVHATLRDLTAASIALALATYAPGTEQLLVCGDGVHSARLIERLRAWLQDRCSVVSTAAAGVDPDWVEPMAFAWLARQTLNGLTGDLPAVTGAARVVTSGGVYPAPIRRRAAELGPPGSGSGSTQRHPVALSASDRVDRRS